MDKAIVASLHKQCKESMWGRCDAVRPGTIVLMAIVIRAGTLKSI